MIFKYEFTIFAILTMEEDIPVQIRATEQNILEVGLAEICEATKEDQNSYPGLRIGLPGHNLLTSF